MHRRIRAYVLQRIRSGEWPIGSRLPSEHALMQTFGVARMTIHGTLKELRNEGVLERVQGSGTFVSRPDSHLTIVKITDIARDIARRDAVHTMQVIDFGAQPLTQADALKLQLPVGETVFRFLALHLEDGEPVQLEDRIVNPAAAPGFLEADHRIYGAGAFLTRLFPYPEGSHKIRAGEPDAALRDRLKLRPGEPCLEIERTTWVGDMVVTNVRLSHPAFRYEISGAIDALRP